MVTYKHVIINYFKVSIDCFKASRFHKFTILSYEIYHELFVCDSVRDSWSKYCIDCTTRCTSRVYSNTFHEG